jgi:Methyltransferase domain
MKMAQGTDSDDLAVKAPKRHKVRLEMLDRMPKGGRCAEIGVWNGKFSAAILEVAKPKELILIDPWDLLAAQPKDEMTHHLHQDGGAMGEMFRHVSAMYADRKEVTIHKGFSAEVLATYDDDYFDWVYIDGNHLYDFVAADLRVAAKKVRLGGIIAGDDFFWKKDERMHVREAVLDFLQAAGLPRKPDRIGQQFMLEVVPGMKALG